MKIIRTASMMFAIFSLTFLAASLLSAGPLRLHPKLVEAGLVRFEQ